MSRISNCLLALLALAALGGPVAAQTTLLNVSHDVMRDVCKGLNPALRKHWNAVPART